MPDLRPFRGLRYDVSVVGDLGAVLCPPYDVISAAERARLAERDLHNAVRLELPDSYEAAAALLDKWQTEGALARDERGKQGASRAAGDLWPGTVHLPSE